MDQLNVALRYLKRIHFWIICPLVTFLGVGAWYMAINKLNEEKETSVGSIQGYYSSVQQVSSTSPHPNPNVASEMDKLITKTKNEIKEAWENKAKQQVDVLTWPDFPWRESQKEAFLDRVRPLRPIERTVKVSDVDRLLINQRQSYRDYILQELPNLARTAGAAWVVNVADSAAVPVNAEQQQANTIVEWASTSQKDILDKHFDWQLTSGGTPSTLEILYAQEDLWVLKHLLQIIARTNEGATTRHSAAVRKIIDIKIGKTAVDSEVTVLGVDGAPGENTRPEREAPEVVEGSLPDPAEGRYVDNNYEPLPAATLRQVMENEGDLPPEQAYLAVAKRIPVRLRVSIDQRHINKLLVECANSELTVEVRQLLINPNFVPGTLGATGGGVGSGGQFAGGSLGHGSPAGGKDDSMSQFPFDLDVEIYGIVSIYNPVDQKALGIVETDGESAAATDDESAHAITNTLRR